MRAAKLRGAASRPAAGKDCWPIETVGSLMIGSMKPLTITFEASSPRGGGRSPDSDEMLVI